jgi:hypothetical protein
MKLGEFKDRARAGIEGGGLASKRKVRWKLESELAIHGLDMEYDGDDPVVSVDLGKRDGGGMEASRAKIDEWPSMPELDKADDDELAALFKPRIDDGKGARKGAFIRPDIPHVDVRKLPHTDKITSASMERSRGALADFADMPDDE